jgi:hypothetical protein
MRKKYGITGNELSVKHSELADDYERKLKEKDAEIKEYRKDHGSISAAFEKIRNSIPKIIPLKNEYRHDVNRVQSPCSVVYPACDWHIGAVQHASEIEGFGEYSPEIAETRIMNCAQRITDWVTLHRNSYNVPEMVIIGMGDLISGDIHEELRRTNEWPSPVQAVNAGALFAKWIAFQAARYEKVRVEFITADNHARLTKKPQCKEEGMNTFNYVVGAFAKEALSRHGNIEFNIHPVHETVITVANRQYLCSHGHDVQGWAGNPWYGHDRKTARESTARLQIIMQDIALSKKIGFHKRLFGHWHTPISLPMYWGMPSTSGTDAYDHKCGRHSEPMMSAWFVHPRHGEFDRTDFNLTNIKQ